MRQGAEDVCGEMESADVTGHVGTGILSRWKTSSDAVRSGAGMPDRGCFRVTALYRHVTS